MPELSITAVVIACLTMIFASTVQTVIGFGLALIAVPVLLLIDPAMVPAPVVICAIVQPAIVVWALRSHIQWDMITIALLGRIPGTLVAMWLLTLFAQSGLKIFIAASVLLAVLVSLFKFSAEPNKTNHGIAGFVAGISGTVAGIGGPPIALLYQKQKGDVIRANLAVFFLVGAVMSLIGMGAVGFVTVTSWIYGLLFIPSIFAGVWLGSKLKGHLKPELMRPAILTLCSLSALAVMGKELFL